MISLVRIWAIAMNTVREAIRNKLLYTLLFFAILMIGAGVVLSTLSYVEIERILQDIGFASIRFFGVAIAIFVGVGLIHKEVDRRTVYTILSKPLSRSEFLVGKYVGLVLTIWIEPQSEEAKQTMALVDQAATLLHSKDTEDFTEFRKKDSKWLKDDTYIFVVDMNGIQLLNPALPKLEGKNVINVKDANGKAQVREMIEIAKTKGSGWVEYMWPKPGESEPSKKMTYIKKVKVGDETLIVGSGFYTD